jgi:Ion channel
VAKRAEAITEARWPVILAVVGLGGSLLALPADLVVGPRWAVPALVGVLVLATILSHGAGEHRFDTILGYAISIIVTLALLFSLFRLIAELPSKSEPPKVILTSASILWVTNFLVFALWYWRLDAGGPHAREKRGTHTAGAFYFPQMMYKIKEPDGSDWIPNFIDYLFLAFATSTTLGPTDTPILSRWAKLLTAVQALISLLCVAILASRAIGLL